MLLKYQMNETEIFKEDFFFKQTRFGLALCLTLHSTILHQCQASHFYR